RARIDDAGAKLVITADGGYRKGKVSALKPAVDQALADRGEGEQQTVEHVLVVKRGGNEVEWDADRDLWWHDVVPAASAEHEAQAFPAEN
ncbi:acetyl-coenzyme A synthetase, partial [Aeromonas veronii]|nr:acetyl-coenzyme A synthetase [Aeromonas veronii]